MQILQIGTIVGRLTLTAEVTIWLWACRCVEESTGQCGREWTTCEKPSKWCFSGGGGSFHQSEY